ncbi:MAG: uracil-DNA glycosylase [Treponema sp.]|jgi:DNA polymerase|nr:uracil-DNA glycosylase [Treponema sp.]
MTVEEKIALASALDMAEDYLWDGYARDRGEYVFAEDPPESAPVSSCADSLEALRADICGCAACPLHKTREKAVSGDGAKGPLVLILEDVPGKEDEEAGEPFAGAAGELLDRMLKPIALSRRTNCYLTSRIKCRPPEDGNPPGQEEFAACAPFLKRELALLKPMVILSFERTTGSGFPEADFLKTAGIPFFSTHHPASIQYDEGLKRPAWEKLKALSSTLIGLDRDYAQTLKTGGRS